MVIRRRNAFILLGGSLLVTAAWLGAESARNASSDPARADASAVVWKGFIPDMSSAKIVQDPVKRTGTEQLSVAEADSSVDALPENKAEEHAVEAAVDESVLPEPMPVTIAGDTTDPRPEISEPAKPATVEPEVKMSLAPLPSLDKESSVEVASASPAESVSELTKEPAPVAQHTSTKLSDSSEAAELVSAILPRTVETKEPEKKPEVSKKSVTAKKPVEKEKTVASTSARKILESLPVKSVAESEAAPESDNVAPRTKDYTEEKKSTGEKVARRTDKTVDSKSKADESKSVANSQTNDSENNRTSGRPLERNELSVAGSGSNSRPESESRSESGSNGSSDKVSGIVVSLSRSNGVTRMLVSSPDRGVVQVVASQSDLGNIPTPGSEVSVTGRRISGNGQRSVIQAESIQRKSGSTARNGSTATVRPRPMMRPGGPVMGPGMPPMMGRPIPGMMPGPMGGPFGGPQPFPMM